MTLFDKKFCIPPRAILVCLMLGFVFSLSSCQWGDKGPASVLIIAVEALNSENLVCPIDSVEVSRYDGIAQMCQGSVRFTHAYTPSVMSQATLSSIFTGKYPFEHRVWHNGGQFLSGHEKTLAELAFEKKYSTSFFSGGPPIWRKSGLAQGFMVFEDNVKVGWNNLFRPAEKTAELFFKWVKKLPRKKSFFSVVYFPDLQFPASPTKTAEGVFRGESFSGQLDEVKEVVAALKMRLEKINRWDNSYVVLVGLNGRGYLERAQEIGGTNLFSENTQVGLLIKPAGKQRDLGVQWKIDTNVSLVDLGRTLFEVLEAPLNSSDQRSFEVVSLLSALKEPKVTWNENRRILIETAWPNWRGVGSSRFSVRESQFLYFHDRDQKMFNSLIDRREVQPLRPGLTPNPMLQRHESFLLAEGFEEWTPLSPTLVNKLKIAQTVWGGGTSDKFDIQSLALLTKKRPWDQQVYGWLAFSALKSGDWRLLESIGAKAKVPEWIFVAQKNLGQSRLESLSGCSVYLRFLSKGWVRPSPQKCDNPLLISLLEWAYAKPGRQKSILQEEFLRKYRIHRVDEAVSMENYRSGLFWDTAIDRPYQPSLVDLFLALPKAKRYRTIVRARFQKIGKRR